MGPTVGADAARLGSVPSCESSSTRWSLLGDRAASDPVLLVLEDVHWADVSTIDLTVYLAHHVDDPPVLLVATARIDEIGSRDRIRILADGIRRSVTGRVVDLAPLDTDDVLALIEGSDVAAPGDGRGRGDRGPLRGQPVLRRGTAHGRGQRREARLPLSLRDVLLHRISGLDGATLDLLRLASVVGRDRGLSRAVRGGRRAGGRRTPLPAQGRGERDPRRPAGQPRALPALAAGGGRVHDSPAGRARGPPRAPGGLPGDVPGTSPAELARHWAAARRPADALPAWIEAARRAERMSGLAEAHGHLERTLALWDRVPGADEIAGLELAEVCTWGARLASHVGAAPRAVELTRRAIELTPADPPNRLALLHVRLGQYLRETGQDPAALAAVERAVALVPERPASHERAYALSALAGELVTLWRFSEALPLAREALAQARAVGAHEAEVRALMALGTAMVHRGGGDRGIACEETALEVADVDGRPARPRAGLRQPHRSPDHRRPSSCRRRTGCRRNGGAAPARRPQRCLDRQPCRGPVRPRRVGRVPTGSARPRCARPPPAFPT